MKIIPDYLFSRVWDIQPAFLSSLGVRALLLDIDNTLAFDNRPEVPDEVRAWLEDLRTAGIRAAIVSNNREPRVRAFAAACGGLPYVCEANKPGRAAFLRSAQLLDAAPAEIAVVGDQLFTDIAFGSRAGCRTILVEKMGPDVPPFVKFKRVLEAPFMPYIRKHRSSR